MRLAKVSDVLLADGESSPFDDLCQAEQRVWLDVIRVVRRQVEAIEILIVGVDPGIQLMVEVLGKAIATEVYDLQLQWVGAGLSGQLHIDAVDHQRLALVVRQ